MRPIRRRSSLRRGRAACRSRSSASPSRRLRGGDRPPPGGGGRGALYERRLVLVRPDGHVAWRADALPEDAGRIVDVVRGAALASRIQAAA